MALAYGSGPRAFPSRPPVRHFPLTHDPSDLTGPGVPRRPAYQPGGTMSKRSRKRRTRKNNAANHGRKPNA